jgi:hypothetical protein
VEHVQRVGRLLPQPVGKRVVVDEERRIVATGGEALHLCVRSSIEETERNAAELIGRWGRDNFDSGDWIAAQEKMAGLMLKLKGMVDGQLRRALPPRQISHGGLRRNVR